MTSTPTACPHYWIVRDGIAVCRDCDATAPIHEPRQPSPEPQAICEHGRPNYRCMVCASIRARQPKPTQSADTSERDAAAEAYTNSPNYKDKVERLAFCAGADWGHAQATAQMGAKLESAEEGERFYRREWESTCERVDYAQEQLAAAQSDRDYQQGWAMKFQRERDALQAKCDAYETALEEIKRRTHFDEAEGPELRAQNAANYRAACTVLAAHKRPTKEAADE